MNLPKDAKVTTNYLWVFLLILSFGAFLRLHKLGAEDIWLDEAISINYHAASTFPRLMLSLARNDSNPPLYFIFLHYWILLGREAFTVRLLSALIGIASIPIFYLLAKTLFSQRAAILGTAFWASSPYHLWYSQEARMYSLQIFFILCASYYFFLILQKDRPGYTVWFLYILFCTAGLYTQYFTLFILAAQGSAIFILWLKNNKNVKGKIFPWILSMFVIALGCLPLFPLIMAQHFRNNTKWIPPMTIQTILQTPFHFLLGANIAIPRTSLIIAAFCFIIILIFIGTRYRKVFEWVNDYPLGSIITITWFAIPILLFFLISFWKPIYLVDRYLINSLPAFYLLLSAGLDYFFNSKMRCLVGAFMFLAIFIALSSYYTQVKKLPLHIPEAIIAKEETAGDILIFLPAWQFAGFQYYLHGASPKYPTANIKTIFYPTQFLEMWNENTEHPYRVWYMTVGEENSEMANFLGLNYKQKNLQWQYDSPILPKTQLSLYQGLVESP
jgi:mannosyltransferase